MTIDRVRISGTVLWSAVPDEQTLDGAQRLGIDPFKTVECKMNDYRVINVLDAPVELGGWQRGVQQRGV